MERKGSVFRIFRERLLCTLQRKFALENGYNLMCDQIGKIIIIIIMIAAAAIMH